MGVYARFICRHRDICAVSVCHLWDETKKIKDCRTSEGQLKGSEAVPVGILSAERMGYV